MTLQNAFQQQADTCARMGSPFMGQLLGLLATELPSDAPLTNRLTEFEDDIGPAGHSLPLRVAGGLHALVLSGRSASLKAAYPPKAVTDAVLQAAVLDALEEHEAFLLDWIETPPQTNEVRRSAALIAGAHVALQHFDRPIVLSELGASGGLNLMWDHYALEIAGAQFGPAASVLTLKPDWDGAAPPDATPHIADRAGVDLNPLNPRNPDDLLRLTAFLWPDQPHRLELTNAAAKIWDAGLARSDAIDWLEHRLQSAPANHLHLIQHTVAWQYFPKSAQIRGTELIEAQGARATDETPLAWLSMETGGDTTGAIGALLTLRLWPGDITLELGRADFHGRWIKWAL